MNNEQKIEAAKKELKDKSYTITRESGGWMGEDTFRVVNYQKALKIFEAYAASTQSAGVSKEEARGIIRGFFEKMWEKYTTDGSFETETQVAEDIDAYVASLPSGSKAVSKEEAKRVLDHFEAFIDFPKTDVFHEDKADYLASFSNPAQPSEIDLNESALDKMNEKADAILAQLKTIEHTSQSQPKGEVEQREESPNPEVNMSADHLADGVGEVTMGVGDGSGNLFVKGSCEAIHRVRSKDDKIASLTAQLAAKDRTILAGRLYQKDQLEGLHKKITELIIENEELKKKAI